MPFRSFQGFFVLFFSGLLFGKSKGINAPFIECLFILFPKDLWRLGLWLQTKIHPFPKESSTNTLSNTLRVFLCLLQDNKKPMAVFPLVSAVFFNKTQVTPHRGDEEGGDGLRLRFRRCLCFVLMFYYFVLGGCFPIFCWLLDLAYYRYFFFYKHGFMMFLL